MKRRWGEWKVLSCRTPDNTKDVPIVKTKELYVDNGKSLSMQRHEDRSELWFTKKFSWHQLVNETKKPLIVIEIQYGNRCIEEDIERFDDYVSPPQRSNDC